MTRRQLVAIVAVTLATSTWSVLTSDQQPPTITRPGPCETMLRSVATDLADGFAWLLQQPERP